MLLTLVVAFTLIEIRSRAEPELPPTSFLTFGLFLLVVVCCLFYTVSSSAGGLESISPYNIAASFPRSVGPIAVGVY